MPCPSELPFPLPADRDVDEHRNLYCSHYDGCLDLAVQNDWLGWSCLQCGLMAVRPNEPQPEAFAHDRRGTE
jgi:hypothetical protein